MPVSLASDVCAYVALDPRALHMGLRVMCTDEQTSVRCASSIPSLAASGKMPETRCMSLPLKYKTCSKRVSKRRAVALAAAQVCGGTHNCLRGQLERVAELQRLVRRPGRQREFIVEQLRRPPLGSQRGAAECRV